MTDINKVLELNKERAQLNEALRVTGRHALSGRSKYAALERISEINAMVREIEHPTVIVEDPLDALSLTELQKLYEEKKDNYLAFDPKQYGSGRPIRGNDPRVQAELLAIDTRIQRLQTEKGAI